MAELGYPFDEPLDAAEDVDAYVDKIGGRAVLPPGTQHADGEPDMRCAAGHPLVLVAQLWAKTPVHSDRFLLVFGCNFGPCSGKQTSWKAFRCIKAAAAPPATAGGPSGAGGQKGSPGQAAGAGGTKGAGVAKAQASSQKPLFAFGAAGDDEWAEDAPAGGIGSASGFEATPAPGSGAGKAGSGTSGAKPPVAEMMELLRQRNQGYSAGSPKPKGKSASVAANVAASAPAKDDEAPAAQGAAPDSQDPPFPASLPALPAYPLEFEREAEAAEAFTHEMRLLEEYKASNPGDAAMLERRQEQVRREASGGGKGDKSDAGEGDAGDEWAGETYERMDVGLDKAFKRFQRRVMQAPEQCIRYWRHGQALWYKHDAEQARADAGGVAACGWCGGPRAFECQLMPHTLGVLPVDAAAAAASGDGASGDGDGASGDAAARTAALGQGMDWGTVAVFTCAGDCAVAAAGGRHVVVGEVAVVQADGQ